MHEIDSFQVEAEAFKEEVEPLEVEVEPATVLLNNAIDPNGTSKMAEISPKGSGLLEKPWRKLGANPWGEKVYETLKDEIVTHKLLKKANIPFFKVLIVGQISAGKSSFVNTIESVFSDHVIMKANAGSVEKSLTTKMRVYTVRAKDRKKQAIKFKFCDTMGLEGGDSGLKASEVAKIMDGYVRDGAELSSRGIIPGDPGHNPNPTDADRIHCVAFVVDAAKVMFIDPDIVKKLKEVREEANLRSLNPMIILTRVDQVCDLTEQDVTQVYHSKAVKDIVDEVARKFGITVNMVYPVQNYSTETEKELGVDILTLRTLRQILRCSEDFLQDKVDQQRSKDGKEEASSDEASESEDEKTSEDEINVTPSRAGKNKNVKDKGKSPKANPIKEYSSDNNSNDEDEEEDEAMSPRGNKAKLRSPSGGQPRYGSILKDFKVKTPVKFSLKTGDRVKEIKPDVGGFTKVQLKPGKKGLVKTSIIEWEQNEHEAPPPPYTPRKAKVLYDYEANDNDEIDVEEDDIVELLEDPKYVYTKVRKGDNTTGTVPTNYIEVIETETPTNKQPPPPPVKKTCTALYEFTARAPDQLDMAVGEQLTVVEEHLPGGWTRVKNKTGKKGNVPASYVKIEAKSDQMAQAPPPPKLVDQAPPPPTSSQQSIQLKTCTALYLFTASGPNQLNMMKGEKLTVLEENLPGGWTMVENESGTEGMIPASYVQIDSTATASQPPPAPPAPQAPPAPPATQKVCTAAYAYTAATPGFDISMAEGEQLTVLQEDQQGWTEVKRGNGEMGMVPTTYLVFVD